MPYLTSWESFAKEAELLYLENPLKVRYSFKYRHQDGKLVVKITDNKVCLMYLAEHLQDVKKIDKLTSQLMRLMATKDK